MADPGFDVAPIPIPTLHELAWKADKGDKAALTELLARCEGNPKALIRAGEGDLPETLIRLLTHDMLLDYPAMEVAAQARCREIQREAEGPNPTLLEVLLAQRIAICWLELYLLEMYMGTLNNCEQKESLKVRAFRDRQRDRADRRYVAAIKALASVRKLKLPDVNVFLTDTQRAIAAS